MKDWFNDFLARYDEIIKSGDEKQMERLGEMVRRTMRWMFTYEPDLAEQAMRIIDDNWSKGFENSLTESEAEYIVIQMDPKPEWSIQQILDMLQSAGLKDYEAPYYNAFALATTMSMILSDSGQTLKDELGSDIRPAKADEILRIVYRLAVDKLKDKDKKFNVRKYFGLSY